MAMKGKGKGARNEHRSMALLEAAGYRCSRSAASLGAWDIFGIGPTDVVLVQVKTRDWPGVAEMETLKEFRTPGKLQETDSPLARSRAVAGREGVVMVNKVVLIGRLGKDPEIKYTNGSTAVASFSLAIEESFKDRSGERQKKRSGIVLWRGASSRRSRGNI